MSLPTQTRRAPRDVHRATFHRFVLVGVLIGAWIVALGGAISAAEEPPTSDGSSPAGGDPAAGSGSGAGAGADSGEGAGGRSKLYDLPLDQLLNIRFDTVYTASRREQRTWEAPSAVSIVTREEIQAFGYRTLGDVLRSAPGIYTTDDHYYTYLGIRGFSRPGDYNSRALLLINGHRANDNIYESALIGQEALIDVEDIERVEIIRGPASSLYGSSAFFGVINVISRTGRNINGVEASFEGGSLETYKGRLAAGQLFESGVEAMVSASYYDSMGNDRIYFREFDTPESNNGVAENLDYERAWHALTTVSYRDLTFSAGFNLRTRGIPTASFGSTFNDARAQIWDRAGYLDLKFERDLPSDVHLLSRVAYHHYDYRGNYPYDAAAPGDPPQIIVNRDEVAGDWWGWEIVGTRPFWSDRLTVTSGLEFRHNFGQEQYNFDKGSPPFFYVAARSEGVVIGAYAQADVAILTNFVASAGVRYDYYSTIGSTGNPRLGLMYRPWDETTFKLLYGRAFRAPNAYETDYAAPGYQASQNLRPETIHTIEAVWEQVIREPVRTATSLFYYDVDDLISLDYSTSLVRFRNLDRARAYGAEWSVEGRWTNGWMARVSYTAQRAEDGDTGEELSNAPRHLAKMHLRVPLLGGRFFADPEILYVGSVSAVRSGRVNDYWLVNFTLLGREILPGLDLSASIYNVFDQDYAVTGSDEHIQRVLPQNGRTFRVQLTYRF
jgi:iron complex outermembrane receptor protein